MLSNCESNIVQIIQINLVLKNGAFDTPEKQFVQIIQINLVLKNDLVAAEPGETFK